MDASYVLVGEEECGTFERDRNNQIREEMMHRAIERINMMPVDEKNKMIVEMQQKAKIEKETKAIAEEVREADKRRAKCDGNTNSTVSNVPRLVFTIRIFVPSKAINTFLLMTPSGAGSTPSLIRNQEHTVISKKLTRSRARNAGRIGASKQLTKTFHAALSKSNRSAWFFRTAKEAFTPNGNMCHSISTK